MAYDEGLAAPVRKTLTGRTDVVVKQMFGGLTFMVGGHMCCGVHQRSDRSPRAHDTKVEELHCPHLRPWDFMKRPMPGMFAVSAAGCATGAALDRWVELALRDALSLPPKPARAARLRRPAL
jgi:TfoX-like protein